jgi:hypothetical protein
MKEPKISDVIVDLYEMRANLMPYRANLIENMENTRQYNFINVIIAKLCDKYKVSTLELANKLEELRKNVVGGKYD